MRLLFKLWLSAVLIVPAGLVSSIRADGVSATALAATDRTVYVTVTDGKGGAVSDLTAADFAVKEGGKDREIVKAEPAKTGAHVALLVEERIAPDGSVRQGLFDFAKRVLPAAQVSLITIALRNTTVVPYTTSVNAVVDGLNRLSLNPPPTSNLMEGILDLSKTLEQEHAPRPVIVVVAFAGGEASGASANEVMTQLRQSGATLYSVTLGSPGRGGTGQLGSIGDESGREQVLGDGAKQSGGKRLEATITSAVPKALQQIADDMSAQYMITYALPDGVKPDRRLSVSVKRHGATLRAPVAIPDR